MPDTPLQPSSPLVLICGDDEFAVQQRARQLFQVWSKDCDSLDREILDAAASNSASALAALGKLRESLQTLPFFGGAKAIWFQGCTFLGDERAASSQVVTESLTVLAQQLKAFRWDRVRLLITAGKVDKRKVFYKTLEKIGLVEIYAGWSIDDREWSTEAEQLVRRQLQELNKQISPEAQARFVTRVGPNSRALHVETEKLATYVGDRTLIEVDDVEAIVTRNKQSRAFALGDAFGDRNLPKLLRTLDEELWEMKRDAQKSEIGLLYGIISKVRVLILLKEMISAGWIQPEADYNRFKSQLQKVPAEALPEDKRFNPLSINPYVLFKAASQAKNFRVEELVEAMDLLLMCNQRLVFSSLDDSMVLQQAFIKIISRTGVPRLG